ncbi:DUF5592 family protein [Lentibacillus salicampi]|uniref:PrgI family protein n=1 Tax=Lentibacillus salicampi TaxID=175306 RepID=A0A4Y9A8W4_9BACI|nr:DUF5592 family protein [Lentibacillus salicampi]TFJ91547.1 hypothetical protein E4U82_17065 [Lentibacillus salicampi]
MTYEIPKEIKAKPKILGLEMRELVILLISSLLVLTILRDLVHSVFMMPYFVAVIGFMIYLFMPSGHNPKKRHYESLILFFRHKKAVYHAMDRHKQENRQLRG